MTKRHRRNTHRRCGSARCGWCSSIRASTPRSGRRSARSRRRSAARRRRCATGCGRPSATSGKRAGPDDATSGSGSRRWSARTASCARPTRSCARRRRILPRRSSTAGSSHDRVHRRSSRRLRGRADLQGAADRPVDLPCACRPPAPIPNALSARARATRPCGREIRRVWDENFGSTACARSGGSCGGRASTWPAAPSRA